MIDEQRTLEIYGYTSDELKPQSNKRVVAVCEGCGKYRDLAKWNYHELCMSCASKKVYEDPMKREEMSIIKKMYWKDNEHRKKQSVSHIGLLIGKKNGRWEGGVSFGKYCPKFNNRVKQYIRDKYNNCDYISGIHTDICNPRRKLDVHHIDYDKQQGCDDHEWRLVPLSQRNHIRTNQNRSFWNRLFTYALQYDEVYYEV